MLDRSRSSMPGRSAMRWSIVGVAVKVVTRWRSMASTARAASNFSSTTRRSPASRFWSVTKALMWYIGASTRIVWGRATGRHRSIIGVLKSGMYTAGTPARITFGVPGRAAAADALHARRHHVGQLGHGRRRRSPSIHAQVVGRRASTLGSMTSRIRSSSQSGTSQRTGIGVAPTFQAANAAKHELGRVAQGDGHPVAEPDAPGLASAPATWLDRRSSSAHVTTRSRAVEADVHVAPRRPAGRRPAAAGAGPGSAVRPRDHSLPLGPSRGRAHVVRTFYT